MRGFEDGYCRERACGQGRGGGRPAPGELPLGQRAFRRGARHLDSRGFRHGGRAGSRLCRAAGASTSRAASWCPGSSTPTFTWRAPWCAVPRFADAVVPRGTTAVVTDCHEIANVMGAAGVDVHHRLRERRSARGFRRCSRRAYRRPRSRQAGRCSTRRTSGLSCPAPGCSASANS